MRWKYGIFIVHLMRFILMGLGLGDIRQSGKTRDSRTPNRDKLSLYTPEYKGNLLIQHIS